MKKILLVCTGNTCRSSMAEVLLKHLLQENKIDDIEVLSAGIMAPHGSAASANAIEVMRQKGLDLSSHQATQITPKMVDEVDLILAMTRAHRERVLNMCPEAADKVLTLLEAALGDNDEQNCSSNNLDISDPYGLNIKCYEACAQEINKYLIMIVNKIKDGSI